MWSELQMKAWPNQASISSEAFLKSWPVNFEFLPRKFKNFWKGGTFSCPKKVWQLGPIVGLFSKSWSIVVSFYTFLADFGIAPETPFWLRFWQEFKNFKKIHVVFFEIYGCLSRGWLSCLAELAGWADRRKRNEDKGGGRRKEGGKRRKKEKEETRRKG